MQFFEGDVLLFVAAQHFFRENQMRTIVLGLALLTLAGCTHTGTVSTVRATNVYSGHDSKVPGKVTYVVDTTSLSKLKKDDTVSGFQCSAHHFPVDGTDAFRASIPAMMEAVFESHEAAEVPQKGMVQLVFRVERFEPRLKFNTKFFGSDADATVEIAVSVTGTLDGKRVFGSSVDSQRTKSGDGGAFCGSGGEVIADATRDAIKDVLEKLGERLANSQQLRPAKP